MSLSLAILGCLIAQRDDARHKEERLKNFNSPIWCGVSSQPIHVNEHIIDGF
jgi:hypothetical protein